MVDVLRILDAFDEALKAFNAANPVTVLAPDGSYIYNNQQMDIAFENTRYVPTVGRPYQETHLLTNQTIQSGNGENGTTYDSGFYQISLYYPRDEGAGAALGRADLLRQFFTRGRVVTSGGVTVRVEHTPSISLPQYTDAWYRRVVSVPYFIYS